MKKLFTVGLFFFCLSLTAQTGVFDVSQEVFGPGKDVLITTELQTLIDRCAEAGGGKVYFPAGEYLTGSLVLKSNVYLELGPGATLYGSTDMKDYAASDGQSLIYAKGVDNVGIIGSGTLNGQGDSFWRGKPRPFNRPERFILIVESTNVHFKDIKMLNSPNWNLEVRNCDGVWIDGVTMISERKAPNSDGIDPVSSRNVFISNCYIEVGDDAICPKSQDGVPTENLVVTNCILDSDDAAIKFGTRSEDPIRNCVFSNIIIRNTDYGIAFFAKDGGTFENIRFNNITIETTREAAADATKPSGTYPIFMDLERREGKLGVIRDIYFSDISIDSPSGSCLFLGQPDKPLENINLKNISFVLHERPPFAGKMKPRGVRNLKNKALNDYSDVAANFSFAHVRGLYIDGLSVTDRSAGGKNERRFLWGYDVHDVSLNNLRERLPVANVNLPMLHFVESSDVEVSNSSPRTEGTAFLEIDGEASTGFTLRNNDLRKVVKLLETSNGADVINVDDRQNLRK
ncbi:glycoside hydrolase family 28 protein [Neolewinella antarctica]|uniref:Glycoside hydrolase family 28 protein n=1 Tax=Neolewinella antarctica TaxID=442734 RepID=A0ABX0X7G1_9BACT|nr:glycosyl hydrolase family 28 protein [Neolewinella antarctica]NJC24936.1 hypothetical protein [Neolewinella antarctica]